MLSLLKLMAKLSPKYLQTRYNLSETISHFGIGNSLASNPLSVREHQQPHRTVTYPFFHEQDNLSLSHQQLVTIVSSFSSVVCQGPFPFPALKMKCAGHALQKPEMLPLREEGYPVTLLALTCLSTIHWVYTISYLKSACMPPLAIFP